MSLSVNDPAVSLDDQETPKTKETQNKKSVSDIVGEVTHTPDPLLHQESDNPQPQPPPSGSGSSSSSESEEEEGEGRASSGGYMLLPQDPSEDDWISGEHDSEQSEAADPHSEQFMGELNRSGAEATACDTLESKPAAVSKMEDTQVKAVKQAMASFTLPSSVMPEWAKVVPEDVWKAELIKGLRTKQVPRRNS